MIVRFLAVLELFKQGVVDLEQPETFAELVVRPLAPGERVALDLASLDEWGDDEDGARGPPAGRRRGPAAIVEDTREGAPVTQHPDAPRDAHAEQRRAIEAVVLCATEPVPPAVLAQLVELPTARVEEICDAARPASTSGTGAASRSRGWPGGYRFQTHPDAYPYVERFVLDGQTARLSGRALETLAIIAYKQPISRAQLSAIRGVNVDATLKTLLARGYVEERGPRPVARQPHAVRHHVAVPRAARHRLAVRPAAARRLRARRVRGRGPRARLRLPGEPGRTAGDDGARGRARGRGGTIASPATTARRAGRVSTAGTDAE
ncbi:MAG: hypothetical protein KatS3mg009_2345 [Acidimicrobiia bacterium]|nr:MAG: hypothetical protein KatS3mg009_2345 [Acidimicrobiia bacterium]